MSHLTMLDTSTFLLGVISPSLVLLEDVSVALWALPPMILDSFKDYVMPWEAFPPLCCVSDEVICFGCAGVFIRARHYTIVIGRLRLL